MTYSELNDIPAAINTLAQCVQHDSNNANALAALGVAYARNKDFSNAEHYTKKAIGLEPENPYALRNFGALFLQKREYDKALYYLKQAFELSPDDPQTIFGLAQAYEHLGDPKTADTYYTTLINAAAPDKMKGLARDARTRIAQKTLAATGFRPDAMLYLTGALDYFDGKAMPEIQEITFEIAFLGRDGLDINSAAKKYTLKSMPGAFSGLHLLCYMYAGMQKIDPTQDVGIDLHKEYASALMLHNSQKGQ